MLPSRITVIALAAIFAAQTFVFEARAQVPTGADLVIEKVDIGSFLRPRVVGVPQHINITVGNHGDAQFSSPTGWQIFIGLNGKTQSDCIQAGEPPADTTPTPASACYIRMTPASSQASDGTNATSIPAGQSRRYSMVWNETTAVNNGWIWVEIGPLGSQPGQARDQCTGPDGAAANGNCQNNWFNLTGVIVGRLGVRADAERAIPPGADRTANSPWALTDADDEACPTPPANITRGCTVKPGKSVVSHFRVFNTGTVDDVFNPAVIETTAGALEPYLRKGYRFDFAPKSLTLAPGTNDVVRLTVFVPDNESAGAVMNIGTGTSDANLSARWTSARAPHISTANPVSGGCTSACDPTLPSLLVGKRREFNITTNETFHKVFAGQTATFNISVNNTGNAIDRFNISFNNLSRSINDSWTPVIINPGEIQPGTNRSAQIQITPPRNATNTSYFFTVTFRSLGDTDGDARCKANEVLGNVECTLTFWAHLAQSFEIAGIADGPARVVPGETVEYKLGIRNVGNGFDNVTLEFQNTIGGWDIRPSNTSLKLTPFNTTPFTLSVTSPPNTLANTDASFFVNATSSGPDDVPFQLRSVARIESRMTVISGPNLRIQSPLNSTFIHPGESAEYTLLITNVGNVRDSFSVKPIDRPSAWSVDYEPKAPLTLEPLQQGTLRVRIGAPTSGVAGERVNFLVTLNSTTDPFREKQFPLEARVSGPDFFIDSVLSNSSNPYAGDTLEITTVVGNSGNLGNDKSVNLTVIFVKGGVEYEIGRKTYAPFDIAPQRRLTETFIWDTGQIEGTGVIIARIDTDNAVREIDDSVASNERTRELTLRTFDIKLTPADGLTARPGQRIKYSEAPNVFLVEYRGNQPQEPVVVRVVSQNGWLTSEAELPLSLKRGAPLIITPELQIPALPGVARDTLTITVVPSLRPDEIIRATTITTLLDEEKPVVTTITTEPATGTLGEKIKIFATIEDATGISTATAYVTLPTNETQPLALARENDGRWAGEKVFTVVGTYKITVEASDGADPANRNITRQLVGTFSMLPGTAPSVKLAAGQSTVIRTGSPIKLELRDPAGIGKASYTIKGVRFDLHGPAFQIDTSTFPAGDVELNVTAENVYGVASTATFRFKVDNEPGEITRVSLSPERPRANAEVTVRVTTAADVQNVDVLVKRDGTVVQTLNATRTGVGTFEVKFNPGLGDHELDVTARDAAGNAKLAEGAVIFSAKPDSPFGVPGPSVALLAIAAAGLALALGRRRRA